MGYHNIMMFHKVALHNDYRQCRRWTDVQFFDDWFTTWVTNPSHLPGKLETSIHKDASDLTIDGMEPKEPTWDLSNKLKLSDNPTHLKEFKWIGLRKGVDIVACRKDGFHQ